MNCNKAKQINLLDFLAKQGFKPQKMTNNQAWYLSPFRCEKTPSFKIDTSKNIWYDFGDGCGGTIIDFVMKLHQCSTTKALEILGNKSFSFQQQKVIECENKANYKILSIEKITNPNLLNYLKSRKIAIEVAQYFCSEIHYTFNNRKRYYGIGFKNDSNGFEIRNKFFKGCLGRKDITSFHSNSSSLLIFESWSDYLSYLTLTGNKNDESSIILNSTSMIRKIDSELKKFKRIEAYFDNDNAGENALRILEDKVPSIELIDNRKLYKGYNDLNEYLVKRKSNHPC